MVIPYQIKGRDDINDYLEFSYPFDSFTISEDGNLEMHEDEEGLPDRLYASADESAYRKIFYTDGVLLPPDEPADKLKVDAIDGNMYVTLLQGDANIKGRGYSLSRSDMKILIPPANVSLPRRDIIVLSMSPLQERSILAKLKKGVPATNPQAPELTQNADTHEIMLAEILVESGTQIITQSNISDRRFDKTVCGIVTGIPYSPDTTDIYNQYDTFLKEKIAEWETIQLGKTEEWDEKVQQLVIDREKLLQTINYIESLAFTRIQKDFNATEYFRGCTYFYDFNYSGDGDIDNIIANIYATDDVENIDKIAMENSTFIRDSYDNLAEIEVKTELSNYQFEEGDLTIIFPDFSFIQKFKLIYDEDDNLINIRLVVF